LLAARENRINNAIALRKPDRVPVRHGVPRRYPAPTPQQTLAALSVHQGIRSVLGPGVRNEKGGLMTTSPLAQAVGDLEADKAVTLVQDRLPRENRLFPSWKSSKPA